MGQIVRSDFSFRTSAGSLNFKGYMIDQDYFVEEVKLKGKKSKTLEAMRAQWDELLAGQELPMRVSFRVILELWAMVSAVNIILSEQGAE